MELKDYYRLLELPASATQADIKKAYRKLAHRFHPDKNNNDPYAAAQFAEIKEAYEVLSHPLKKAYYLQQRWYNRSTGNTRTGGVITPVSVLQQVLELERHVSKLDMFRMDKQGLHNYAAEVMSDEVIEKINSFHDMQVNDEIAFNFIRCLRPLPLEMINPLLVQTGKLELSISARQRLHAYAHSRHKQYRFDRYRVWLVLFIVALICLLIYLSAESH